MTDQNTLQSLQNGMTGSTIDAASLATNDANVASSNFAYSCWFYVNDWNYRYGEPKVIFGRMSGTTDISGGDVHGVSGTGPCPLVVLGELQNNLLIYTTTYPTTGDSPSVPLTPCEVSNIPIQKWVNLVVSVYGRTIDIYIDGKLVRTCLLPGIVQVSNQANVLVTPNGGFDGWTSKIQYFPNSINPQDAWDIYIKGYSGNFLSNLFGSYQIQFSLIENGVTQNSVTL